MSIRSRLVVLVLAVIVPAIVASGWAVYTTYGRETDAVERTLRETTRAMALLVEREIEKRETAALILATSPSLLAADLETFRNHALAAIRPLGGHVVLADANRQLLNTSAELGRSLPPLALPTQDAQFDGVQVSPMLRAAGFDEPLIAVTVPVAREGAAAWNLSVTMTPSQLQRVISDQSLPQGWTAAVLDQQGVVVARQPDPARWIGTPAQPDLRERAARDREGIFQTVTLDGSAVTAFFSRSPRYGWTFAIGVPRTVLGTTVSGPLAEIAIAAALLLALAVLAAARVGRGVATAIESLRDSAHAMERGERIEAARSGVQETDEVAHALARASTRIRDANDALERRVAEAVAETQAAQQKLLHTQKMDAIGQLTGGIAHDFNNLLQTLATGQQVLARLVNDPRARPVLEACERAVHKAAKLTQQLLAFGRRQTFSSGSIDLRDQVLGIRELLAGALREDIVLSIELAPDLWPVQADSTQLELALLNIALNARDAMPQGGRLRIAARNVKLDDANAPAGRAGEFVRLTIEDSGEGIPPDVLPKVFDPFFTTKEVGKGSGLGLSQVYAFARQCGGSVEVGSELGRGTTVTLTLPRALVPVSEPRAGAPAARIDGDSRTVLFVEDDVLVSDVVGSALEGMGFRLLKAHDAEQALTILRSDATIDVVFSDVVMPGGVNGFELANAVRTLRPELPVVLATGYTDKGSQIGGLTVLAKPYTIASLVEALRAEQAPATANR